MKFYSIAEKISRYKIIVDPIIKIFLKMRFQLLKYEDLQLSLVLYYPKLNLFWFWIKQDINLGSEKLWWTFFGILKISWYSVVLWRSSYQGAFALAPKGFLLSFWPLLAQCMSHLLQVNMDGKYISDEWALQMFHEEGNALSNSGMKYSL